MIFHCSFYIFPIKILKGRSHAIFIINFSINIIDINAFQCFFPAEMFTAFFKLNSSCSGTGKIIAFNASFIFFASVSVIIIISKVYFWCSGINIQRKNLCFFISGKISCCDFQFDSTAIIFFGNDNCFCPLFVLFVFFFFSAGFFCHRTAVCINFSPA